MSDFCTLSLSWAGEPPAPVSLSRQPARSCNRGKQHGFPSADVQRSSSPAPRRAGKGKLNGTLPPTVKNQYVTPEQLRSDVVSTSPTFHAFPLHIHSIHTTRQCFGSRPPLHTVVLLAAGSTKQAAADADDDNGIAHLISLPLARTITAMGNPAEASSASCLASLLKRRQCCQWPYCTSNAASHL